MSIRSQVDLRCFCHHKPLMAKYGLDDEGNWIIHIKVFRSRKIITETIFKLTPDSAMTTRCRDCGRWHSLVARAAKVEMVESEPPMGAAIAS